MLYVRLTAESPG